MSIIVLLSIGFFFLAMIYNIRKNIRKQSAKQRQAKPIESADFDDENESDEATEYANEGTPTVRNVRQKSNQPKKPKARPATHVTSKESEDDDETEVLIPDFSDEDDVKKAVVTAEILNRKY